MLKVIEGILVAVIISAYSCLTLAPILMVVNRPPVHKDEE